MKAWLNEKLSPILLEQRAELVECVMEQLQQMETNIQNAPASDSFKVSLHRLEVDRIRYVLSSYIRTRLLKIEKYSTHLLKAEAERLTEEELAFAKEYEANLSGHYKQVALQHMPPNMQTLKAEQAVVQPELDRYVFLRVKEDVDGVLVEEETMDAREEVLDLTSGDQHIMRFRPLAQLVTSGAVSLL